MRPRLLPTPSSARLPRAPAPHPRPLAAASPAAAVALRPRPLAAVSPAAAPAPHTRPLAVASPAAAVALRAVALRAALVAFGAAGPGCAAPPAAPKAPVAVVLLGDAASAARARAALAASPLPAVDVRFADLPVVAAPQASSGAVESGLAAARAAYVEADTPSCLAALGDDATLAALLLEGRRITVARVLFWRVACHVVASEREEAEREARGFAALGLEIPPDAEAASPEVEATIGRALGDAAARAPVPLRVAAAAGIEVAADGRATGCTAPCTLELRPGVHFVTVHGDGIAPVVRRVSVPDEIEITIATVLASPELAAQQWSARYAGGPLIESNASVVLLARAVRARNLAVLFADVTQVPGHLRGVLAVNGTVPARAERALRSPSDATTESPALLRELLVSGRVLESTPLVKNPWFWGSVAAAAAVATVITYAALQQPPTRTEVRF